MLSTAHRRARLAGLALLALLAPLLGVVVAPTASAAALPTVPKVVDGAVNALAVLGDRVFVGGTFTQVQLPNGTLVAQPSIFAYSLTTGAFDTGFRPVVTGGELEEVEPAPGGTAVYVAGAFTTVNGVTRRRIARVNLDGSLDTRFAATPNSKVGAVTTAGNRVFLGGQFATVGGVARNLLAEVDPVTGAVVPAFDFSLSGSLAAGGFTQVQSLEVSPDRTKLLVAHNATQVAGQERVGVAIIDLRGTGRPADVLDPWFTTLWKDAVPNIGGVVKITDAAWGPDSRWIATVNAGGDRPPTNDSAQRFDVTGAGPVAPRWVTRQFDSTYTVSVGPDGTVYTGGHFRYTEAPGSAEPYPGDPLVNYGWGQDDGGARVLGDQVVGRMQLSALDPLTGTARNWAQEAIGKEGVKALLATGDRLLVGHDGDRVGGLPAGRHGAVPLFGAARATGVPLSATTSPIMGAVLPAGAVTLRGTATAPRGVSRVLVEVKVGTQWLRGDGTVGALFQWPATLATPGATSTAWSLALTLPTTQAYVAISQAQDSAALKEVDRVEVPFETVVPVANPSPVVTFTTPEADALLTNASVTVAGTMTDVDGVARARIAYYDRGTGQYLQDDGSLAAAYDDSPLTLATPGAVTTTWTQTRRLPDGPWSVNVRATDGAGNTTLSGELRKFTVSVNNAPPVSRIGNLVDGQAIGTNLTVTGTATDDRGVEFVFVRVRDTRFGRGSTTAGFGPVAQYVQATLARKGTTSTTWSATVTGLPFGTYDVDTFARDALTVDTPAAQRVPVLGVAFRPAGAVGEPATTLTSPVAATFRPTTLSIPVAGTASYARGVAGVRVAVRQVVGGRYVKADGTLSATIVFLDATLGSPGATSTTFSRAVVVPAPAAYRVDAFAVGTDGNPDWTQSGGRANVPVFPGDADPTFSTWGAPVDGSTVTGGKISANGRADDDTGVRSVELRLRTSPTSGLRRDGTIGVPEWVPAFVTNPGGVGTNFTYVSPTLPPGTWQVSLRATDVVGKTMITPLTRTVTLTR